MPVIISALWKGRVEEQRSKASLGHDILSLKKKTKKQTEVLEKSILCFFVTIASQGLVNESQGIWKAMNLEPEVPAHQLCDLGQATSLGLRFLFFFFFLCKPGKTVIIRHLWRKHKSRGSKVKMTSESERTFHADRGNTTGEPLQ